MSYITDLGQALLGRRISRALSAKASAFGPMIARLAVNRPVWPGVDFEKLAKEGYQQNAVVAHAVDLLARSVATIPIVAYKGKGKKRTEIEEHAVLDLLANPNPDQDGVEFLKAWVSNFTLTGNAYLERTGEDDPARMELYVLRTDRTKVVPGEDGFARAYEYSVGGATRRIEIDIAARKRPILHDKTFNPLNDWYGMSPLQPCAWAVDIVNESSAWNLGILRNSGAPSGAFVFAPKEGDPSMTEEQREVLRREMREHIQGSRNAGMPLVLEGGLDWKQMGLNPEQMQYVEGAYKAAREICFVLGVPPMMLGIPGDNTYSNYQEARQAFYQDTVIPMARRMSSKLTHWFARQLGEGVRLEPNTDGLEALAGMRKDLLVGMQAISFLSVNEKREQLGYDRLDVDGADDIFVGAGQIPLGTPSTVAGGAAKDPPSKGKPKSKDDGKAAVVPPSVYHQRNDLP